MLKKVFISLPIKVLLVFVFLIRQAKTAILCSLLLFAGLQNCYAQSRVDSLRKILHTLQHDTTRVLILLQIANDYEGVQVDSVKKFGYEAFRIASKHKYHKGIANAYEIFGMVYSMSGNNDSALHYFQKSLSYASLQGLNNILSSKYNHIANVYFNTGKYSDANTYYDSAIRLAAENGNIEIEAKANSNLANVFYKMGNYSRALNYYLQGLRIQEKLGLSENIATDLANIANVYYRLGMYSKSIVYIDRAMALHKKSGTKERIVGTLTTYALIYNDRKMYDSSLYYLYEAKQLAEEMQSPFLQNILIGNIAEAFLKKGDLIKAAELYKRSAEMSVKLDDPEGLAFARAGLGEVMLKQANTIEGRKYMKSALDIMLQLGIREQALEMTSKLAKSYQLSGDYKNAYHFLNIQNSLADSLKKEKAKEEVKQLIFNYEIRKKEDEIKLLQKDNAIIESKNKYQQVLLRSLLVGLVITTIIAYLLFRNMQQVRKSRKLIEQQAQKLSELNDFKDNTFSVLAHDLRSPVNALTSTMQLLDEEIISPAEFVTYKQELNNKLQSVSILLDNMLHWAKSQMKGEHMLEIERLNIKRKVLRTVSVLGDAAKQKNINITSNVPSEVWALGDKDHIDIVIRNLVSNAIKFTHEGGVIHIAAEINGAIADISITDTGVGMTPGQVRKLFAGDAHISTKGTEGEKGTGLGLNLCYDLIKKNKGDIKVSSTPGKGSTFTIQLPTA